MKLAKTIVAVLVVALSLTAISCKDAKKENTTNKTTSTEEKSKEKAKEYTSAYICTMHCKTSGSDKKGDCIKCGMTYVENKIHNANGHKH